MNTGSIQTAQDDFYPASLINPHALRTQQNMKIRQHSVFIFSSIFWGAKRHHYSTLDVHFHIKRLTLRLSGWNFWLRTQNGAVLPGFLVPMLCVGMHTGRLCLPFVRVDCHMTLMPACTQQRGGASDNELLGRARQRDIL